MPVGASVSSGCIDRGYTYHGYTYHGYTYYGWVGVTLVGRGCIQVQRPKTSVCVCVDRFCFVVFAIVFA